jgi:hypothetical protein
MELGHYGWNRKVDIFQQHAVFLDLPAPATSNYGVLNIGNAPFDGISSGCFNSFGSSVAIGINSLTSANYYALYFQVSGSLRFSVDGDGIINVHKDPFSNAGYGVANLGTQFFSGAGQFAGSANGTYLAINSLSGFIGNFIDCQVAGASVFAVTNAGNVTVTTVNPTKLTGLAAVEAALQFT